MKTIIAVSFEIPGHSEMTQSYNSSQSLLDADIILFQSDFSQYRTDDSYNGKTCYEQNDSFRLKEDTEHWKHELLMALQAGKTVFVIFREYEECYVHTGQKTYSGT